MKKLLLLSILSPIIILSQTQINNSIIGETDNDNFGHSVSLNSDGSIVAVGAIWNNDNGYQSGHVRIFQNVSDNWIQIGDDINGESVLNKSGYSISLNNDGNIVAIGSPMSNGNGQSSGHVRIFQNISDNWIQIGNNINGESIADNFGYSVSLSNNGSIVAIGARFNDGNGQSSGHVQIFQNISDSWIQIGNDIDGEASGDLSGYSVSLSGDGNIVAISGVRNNDYKGHVRIFQNISDNWIQIGNDIDGEETSDYFGYSVSLSSNGSIIAIGERGNSASEDINGHVRIYENISGNWIQIGGEINGDEAANFSGYSVSLNSDGNIIAIGAPLNSNIVNGYDYGRVHILKNISGNWIKIGIDINGEIEGVKFGYSVSLSDDGSTVAVGAPGYLNYASVFNLSSFLSTEEQTSLSFDLYPNPTKTQFSIQLENSTVLKNVNIYNNLGQLVLNSKETIINSSKLSAGLYVVEVETNKGKGSKKLIIE